MSPLELSKKHFIESSAVKLRLAESAALRVIVDTARQLAACVERAGKIMLYGNGGSAADCQHLATEFTSRLRAEMELPAIAVTALTTDTSFLTARANGQSFDDVFERLVDALGRKGDAPIGISTSGGSGNVIRAVSRANAKGILTGSVRGVFRASDCISV